MEFTTLPPEVISALIHSGPGAESLANAAAAWQQLSANLEDAADNYAASLSSMDETWYGPSSAAMFQSVTPYVTWLRTTAQQAQQTAAAAQSAAAAFNSVQASVVPTATVAANRTRLAQLLATNTFGRNLPAIAQTESEYQTMWANNAAAMTRYQAASSQASTLPQLTSPTSTTNPSDLATQASSATPAATTSSRRPPRAVSGGHPRQRSCPTAFDSQRRPSFGAGNTNIWNQFFSSGFPINLLSYLAQNQSAQALAGCEQRRWSRCLGGRERVGWGGGKLGWGCRRSVGGAGPERGRSECAGRGRPRRDQHLGGARRRGADG